MSKAAAGKHWYNNGVEQKYFSECPEGWKAGRLPISEETRRKHVENNGMHNMNEEQKQSRLDKIKAFRENESLEHKKHKSEAISAATKGKHKGREPWNKGKKGVQKAWNKGKRLGPLSEEKRANILAKQHETKKRNNSFNTSSPEDNYYYYLCEKYSKEDVIRQYKDDRYPYSCDFYIKSKDLFIELNLTWTHNDHPFDKNNAQDLKILERWKKKAETSDYYKNAVYVWTDLDIRKQKTARENKLNYKTIYLKDLYE